MKQPEICHPYLGEWIKQQRKKRNLTLRQFCRAMNFLPAAWSRAERGISRAILRTESTSAIARLFKLNYEEKALLERLRLDEAGRPLVIEKQEVPLFFSEIVKHSALTGAETNLPASSPSSGLESWDPPALHPGEIKYQALVFRRKHFPARFPLDMEAAIEFQLGMDLVPLPRIESVPGGKAFINADFSRIFIEQELFENPRHSGWLRFLLAHELGHMVLHKKLQLPLVIDSPERYLEFILGISEKACRRLEWQANRFAGALLVPQSALEHALQQQLKAVPARQIYLPGTLNGGSLKKISKEIAPIFGVSSRIIRVRLKAENLWPPI